MLMDENEPGWKKRRATAEKGIGVWMAAERGGEGEDRTTTLATAGSECGRLKGLSQTQ
jgi:hypothetical protein